MGSSISGCGAGNHPLVVVVLLLVIVVRSMIVLLLLVVVEEEDSCVLGLLVGGGSSGGHQVEEIRVAHHQSREIVFLLLMDKNVGGRAEEKTGCGKKQEDKTTLPAGPAALVVFASFWNDKMYVYHQDP